MPGTSLALAPDGLRLPRQLQSETAVTALGAVKAYRAPPKAAQTAVMVA